LRASRLLASLRSAHSSLERSRTAELHEETIAALSSGLSMVLRLYAQLGFQSFNLAIHGAAGVQLVLRVVARAYFGPLQRSDVMWSERLHGESATDISPEMVAELARQLLRAVT
jgi:galactose-1-phosphate uridylyltransferase